MTGAERLRILSAALRQPLPERLHFNLGVWRIDPKPRKTPGPVCGTICCAVGYGTMLPALQAEGLGITLGVPFYKGAMGFSAVEAFFDLSRERAEWLFHERQYREADRTPEKVADRIDAYVNRVAPHDF